MRNSSGGDVKVTLIEDSSRAGQDDRDGQNVQVFVEQIRGRLSQEISSGRGLGRTIEQTYGVSRRGRA